MQCPRCLSAMSDDAQFCAQCGAPCAAACGGCGSVLPPAANFCATCGQARESVVPQGSARPGRAKSRRHERSGERRQLTVMFCDVVDSTAMSERLDPEELRQLMRVYYAASASAVRRFDGHIARYLGDGLLIFFGYPQAHEDDAVRAVSSALALQDDLPRINQWIRENLPALKDKAFQLRIGIHTGPVVAGALADGAEPEILGGTLNVAARLQDIAQPGAIVISKATRRLLSATFALEDLGAKALKGIAAPVPVFRVVGAQGRRRHARLDGGVGLTPLIGREREMALLVDRWQRVKSGHGQVVLVGAEAGMGKSRLVRALYERVAGESHAWIESGGSPYYENSAFYPVVELLHRGLAFSPEDFAGERLAKLERALADARLPLAEVVPLFARLLSLPLPATYEQLTSSPEAQRRRTLVTLSTWLLGLARRQPLVVAIEDLHWLDPSTLELLGMLIEGVSEARVLLLLTFRPSFEPPWPDHAQPLRLELNALTHAQTASMVERIAGEGILRTDLLELVAAKTDGVPLFVEELTKAVLEWGNLASRDSLDPLRNFTIPSTLQDSLTARLDRLGDTKEVAMLAAVLGREFSYELLRAVSPLTSAALEEGLAQLVDAELLQQRGAGPRAVYVFKHSLIRDTAYQSLLKARRQELHARVAAELAAHPATEPELIARHHEEAGQPAEAVAHYQRAGEQATTRSENAEAVRHLRKGIALLGQLPEGPERDRQELVLQVMLGAPLQAAKGFSDPAVERAYGRARELCQQIGEAPQLFQALFGLTAFYQTRGQLQVAYELGQQLLALAQRTADPALILLGHMTVGNPLYWMGKPCEALEHLNHTIALYDPAVHRSLAYAYGQEPGVVARTFAALSLWSAGYPDQAERRSAEAIQLARDSAHALSLAFALGFAGVLHWMRREPARVSECSEELVALSEEQSFPLWLGLGLVQRGWARIAAGQAERGNEDLQQGLTRLATTGAEVGSSLVMAILGEIRVAEGHAQEALAILDAALAAPQETHGVFFDPELYRLKGDILLRSDGAGVDEAEGLFRTACAVARGQNAKSLELRATVSLSRLLRQGDRKDEARTLLAEVVGWFREGHHTPDLEAAGALLAELS